MAIPINVAGGSPGWANSLIDARSREAPSRYVRDLDRKALPTCHTRDVRAPVPLEWRMTMQVEMHCLAGRPGPGLAELTKQRLQRALGRFANRVQRVRVCLNDVNGPRGGIDKRCRMRVDLVPRGAVVVEAVGAAFEQALFGAADRLVRRVRTMIDRKREAHRRHRPPDQSMGLTEEAT